MRINAYLAVLMVMLGCCTAGLAFADNPHEISANSQTAGCVSCHVEMPQNTSTGLLETKNHRADHLAEFKDDGVKMCSGCHDAEDGHKVGLKLDFEVPADMPLGPKNKLTCLTCHYTHGSLKSTRPQASFSLMDQMLDAERLRKSFLLRRNNAEGELCLTCHEVKEGSK